MAFLELLFNCDKNERCLTFGQIASHCLVQKDEVEMLVMKAMSLELVRGAIDQVSETVAVDWIMPRYLTKDHLRVISARLSAWEEKMNNIVRVVENGSEELLQK